MTSAIIFNCQRLAWKSHNRLITVSFSYVKKASKTLFYEKGSQKEVITEKYGTYI